ncbi:trp operon repressor [bacterium]|nr:trp operon repressor [bacterium]
MAIQPADKSTDKKRLKLLIETLSSLKNQQDLKDFLYDLCTPAELESLSDRWEVAKLIEGGENYRNIAEKTKISTTTITRVGRSLKYGTGGYRKAMSSRAK